MAIKMHAKALVSQICMVTKELLSFLFSSYPTPVGVILAVGAARSRATAIHISPVACGKSTVPETTLQRQNAISANA